VVASMVGKIAVNVYQDFSRQLVWLFDEAWNWALEFRDSINMKSQMENLRCEWHHSLWVKQGV
jgi:hypothetical protein